MEIALDRFGRIVIPKRFREDLGLEAGSRLEIEEQEGRIVLTVHRDEPDLVQEDGVLVYTGEAAGDLEEAVSVQRRRRSESGLLPSVRPDGRSTAQREFDRRWGRHFSELWASW